MTRRFGILKKDSRGICLKWKYAMSTTAEYYVDGKEISYALQSSVSAPSPLTLYTAVTFAAAPPDFASNAPLMLAKFALIHSDTSPSLAASRVLIKVSPKLVTTLWRTVANVGIGDFFMMI
jgi:hypothetical protein